MNKLQLGILFILFLPLNIYSQSLTDEWELLNRSGVYENYEIRQKHRAVILSKSFEAVDAPKRVFSQSESDINVRFEVRKTADSYYLVFLNEYKDRFPVWSSGSYLIKKDLITGDFLQAKIFLFNDEDSFIRIYPEQDRSRLDLHIFGKQIYDGVRIPLKFENLILLPLSKIISLTKNKIPWESLLTDISYSEWRDVENFNTFIRSQVTLLGDADDGAIDENGNYVYIETLQPQVNESGLNCSGFSKWTVDLLYKKLTGQYLPIEPLKVKHYDLRGNSWSNRAEDARDPYFGLDWTRNIGYYYRKALYPEQNINFLSTDINSAPYFIYHDNVGYEMDEIKAVLYLSAIKNPGRIYLGSVNAPFGGENLLRQHIHIVVLFPYINEFGEFIVDVIERETITSIESLLNRYSGEYMHLVNIELN